jgi:signal recognition particle subunit SRP54
MFDALTRGFRAARQKLTGLAELSEDNIDQALRDVRRSLLEADVELGVVKTFLARVKENALGQVVQVRAASAKQAVEIAPGDVFIKICQDELVRMMRDERGEEINYAPKGQPTVVMMVGLQGQGKTTTSAKLARLYAKDGKRVLLVAADLQRPAAIEQLKVLGDRVNVPVFAQPESTPVEVCRKALQVARVQKRDVVIFDTAGRLAIDERLMDELAEIKRETAPQNVLLVVNAAIGQNALQTARTFHEKLGLTGAVLTMLDGDARGGAALSIREVTGVPIKFAGVGESLEKLEAFRPEGMASRVLGFGDVIGLMKDFSEVVDEKKAEQDALRMLRDQFTFDDFLDQIGTIQKMGPLQDLFEKMPFFPEGLPTDVKVDDRELDKVRAMIHSMTKAERADSSLFAKQPGRIKRVAKGSGRTDDEVGELIEKFNWMKGLMGGIGRQAGMLSKIPGAKQLAMAKRLRDMVKVQGQDAAISNIATEMLEAAVAGGGTPGAGGMPEMTPDFLASLFGGMGGAAAKRRPEERDRKKKQRKQERQARKKSRRK